MPNDNLPCRGECVEASGSDDSRCGCRFSLNLGNSSQTLECSRLLGHTGNHAACMFGENKHGLVEWNAGGLVNMDDKWWMQGVCESRILCEGCVLDVWPNESFCIKNALGANHPSTSIVLAFGEDCLAIAREKLAEVKEELGIQIAKGCKSYPERLPDMWGML